MSTWKAEVSLHKLSTLECDLWSCTLVLLLSCPSSNTVLTPGGKRNTSEAVSILISLRRQLRHRQFPGNSCLSLRGLKIGSHDVFLQRFWWSFCFFLCAFYLFHWGHHPSDGTCLVTHLVSGTQAPCLARKHPSVLKVVSQPF